ncbi:MAG: tRNA-dihydrouridine synthase family protein [Deltaproteobacteria bacterium]|nr:tRNA-dihydrouridine synthase family protein [Deltaproteobacteria bacterium]
MNHTLTLGGHTLASPFLLAPLEGVSDAGFRRLCFEQGASLTFTEMIRARGLAKHNKATFDLIDIADDNVLTGIQLLATSPQELVDALSVVEELAKTTHPQWLRLAAVDLNFGCPSKDIIQQGAGPAMLKRRGRMEAIFQALAGWKKTTSLPVKSVSAKIRLGLNQRELEHRVFLPIVELASAHLDYVVVHARHAGQRSRDAPTWGAIAEAKKASKVPVIGNGDVVTRADAVRMHEETGCDGFLIARGAIQSPWVFRALRELGSAKPTVDEVVREIARYEEASSTPSALGRPANAKYRAFHAENFARLLRVAKGETSSTVIPANAHM